MPSAKTDPPSSGPTTRERVLQAAERLLGTGRPEFSMRELAADAGVSFATPFNLFGAKGAILHALSAQRIETMHARFAADAPTGDAAARVLAAVGIAGAVMLDRPAINRAVMGALGAPSSGSGGVWALSRALWAEALGDGEGLAPRTAALARNTLPDHLALTFRGVLSFWTAGEIADRDLGVRAHAAAAALLLGFVDDHARERLEAILSELADGERRT
jgi:AcrR family transcriptional regulator